MVIMILMTGAFSLDVLEIMSTKSRLAIAVNNVVVDIYELPEAEWTTVATSLLNANFPEENIQVVATVTKTANGCRLSASASVPSLALCKISDKTSYTVTERVELTKTTSSMTKPKKEIALALDYSGSMEGSFDKIFSPTEAQKLITHMKTAVEALLTEAATNPDLRGRVRVSLIPYDSGVNIGLNRPWVTGGDPNGECAQTRYPSFSGINAQYTADQAMLPAGSARVDYYEFRPHSVWLASYCPHEALEPLTDDFTKLNNIAKSIIPKETVQSASAQDIGLIWAARTLLPSWNTAWGGLNNPSISADVDKQLVIITDGEMGGGLGMDTPDDILNDSIGRLCTRLKDDGITINIIEYHRGSKSETFKNCSSAGRYLTPTPSSPASAQELTDAVLLSLEESTATNTIVLTDY